VPIGGAGENKNAHYLCCGRGTSLRPRWLGGAGAAGLWSQILRRSVPRPRSRSPEQQTLAGYAGLWLMVGRAMSHYRRAPPVSRSRPGGAAAGGPHRYALEIDARWTYLEVRVSMGWRRRSIGSYGFKPAGIRQRYYSDNQEMP